ncbi:MAG: glucosaminidase domain-containing protein [Lutibacter sp.]|nr:glucosaminidase domain-containing protein [Lutibacter sp.]
MKLKVVLICLLTIGFLSSCNSKKKVVHSKHKIQPTEKKAVASVEKSAPTEKAIETKSIATSTIEYINTYKDEAMKEMREFKIPASIKLAQGIIESSSGNSDLTKRSNNHFGIKCHKGWEGEHTLHDDDEKGECFRVYKDPLISFRDHSLFLTTRSRYANLFKLKDGDYVGWAQGLSEAGYATDRRYPAKLIGLIEKYDLHKYDAEVLGIPFKKVENMSLAQHIVVKGDTLYNISKRYGLSVEELKKINALASNEISIGQELNVTK